MAYIAQQVLVGLGLAWALWVLWGEVRGLMGEAQK
mgnify:CR=1 FL=1